MFQLQLQDTALLAEIQAEQKKAGFGSPEFWTHFTKNRNWSGDIWKNTDRDWRKEDGWIKKKKKERKKRQQQWSKSKDTVHARQAGLIKQESHGQCE